MTARSLASQWATVLVLIALLAAIAYWKPEWLNADPEPQPGPEHAGRYEAIDGDSFRLGSREIRLHGIDAPEFRQTCKDKGGNETPCGKMARDQLTALVGGKAVTCRLVERDRYRREVSTCSAGRNDLNREMVRLGWAMAYRKHSKDYVPAENEARTAGRGLWQLQFDRPEEYRNRHRPVQGGLGGLFKDE